MKNKILKHIHEVCQGDCDSCIDLTPDPCVQSANKIIGDIVEELEDAIRGKYPEGNTFSDQMGRVRSLIEQWNKEKFSEVSDANKGK